MRSPNLTAAGASSENFPFERFPQRPHLHSCARHSVIFLILTGISTTCRPAYLRTGVPPGFLRSRRFQGKCRRSRPGSRSASASRRGDRAGRQTPGSTCGASSGFGFDRRRASPNRRRGRLAAVEAVPGRAALEFVHPLLEGELFRIALGEFRFRLVALRFGPGQFRFVLGEFLRERGTRRTSPGTIVRARSDEFGSPPAGGVEPCAGYGGSRIHDSHIGGLERF